MTFSYMHRCVCVCATSVEWKESTGWGRGSLFFSFVLFGICPPFFATTGSTHRRTLTDGQNDGPPPRPQPVIIEIIITIITINTYIIILLYSFFSPKWYDITREIQTSDFYFLKVRDSNKKLKKNRPEMHTCRKAWVKSSTLKKQNKNPPPPQCL